MPVATYDPELVEQAIAIAEAAGAKEASLQTGIPAGTIRCWLSRRRKRAQQRNEAPQKVQRNTPERSPAPPEPRSTGPRKMTLLQQEVSDLAVQLAAEKVAETLADRLTRLADRLYGLAAKAAIKVERAIADKDEVVIGDGGEQLPAKPEPHDRDGAAWVRALVGVLAQSVDKAQLLSGKPTVRPEVIERYEYEITQRIVTERPELLDAIFGAAAHQRPGLEDRGG